MTTISNDLEKFLKANKSTHVVAHNDCLVYNCRKGLSDKAAHDANELISELGLDLVAISGKWPYDTYLVKSNLTYDV